ncbi:MAG: NarK/NasA family nitrate transporter [Pseudomonadales bacterium]|nr:NarK/NasA family nitrate transporter [Pseudomonadales bacterium]MCP5173230.1 NarK/NasA family nitrate transporter [Pseudomonadales bacterium]
MAIICSEKWYSLGIATVIFAANFAAWTMLAVLGVQIRADLGLSDTSFGLLLAMPILTGAFSHLPAGILAERFGGRMVLFTQTVIVALSLFALAYADTFYQLLTVGLLVGVAGGTFISGVTYVSDWFERSMQGTAMGIFGAGVAGAAITNLLAPLIIANHGWQAVPFYYAIVLVILALAFWLTTKPDTKHSGDRHAIAALESRKLPVNLSLLKELRVWRFGLYYHFVFGGFIALVLWLPQYYAGEYGLDLKTASFLSLLFAIPASMARALGGWFADNFGARKINWAVFWVCLVCLFFLSYPKTTMIIHGIEQTLSVTININLWVFTLLIFVVGVAMGFGKASIYRIIYDYYPQDVGVVGGAVGTIGTLGGFTLPILFGLAADITGIRSSCFMLLYGMLAGCMVLMFYAIKIDAFQHRVKQAYADEFLTL